MNPVVIPVARVTIERLGHLGDGIAPGPVYAPRTLPGEVVEGAVAGTRMAAPKIVTPSPARIRPPCPHYRACGGCALMHAADGFVADWKLETVRRALEAQGIAAEINGPVTSPPFSRRRATLTARRLRGGPVAGFHGRASATVVDVPECRLLRPELTAALPAARALAGALASRKGALRITLTATEAGVDASVADGRPLDAALRAELATLAERHDLARLTLGDDPVALRRPPVLRFDGIAVAPPPGAFLQATREGEAALRGVAAGAVAGARRIVDLFTGCGTFALPLARGAEVHAVEAEPGLLAALDRGWRGAEGLRAVSTESRDLFRRPLEGDELARFDAAVIDPPRAGAEAQTRALAAAGIPRIAAISCNPASFARDARILMEAGYAIGPVTVVDQFRWSTHVELAAAFRSP